jgi:hypothetical protein
MPSVWTKCQPKIYLIAQLAATSFDGVQVLKKEDGTLGDPRRGNIHADTAALGTIYGPRIGTCMYVARPSENPLDFHMEMFPRDGRDSL